MYCKPSLCHLKSRFYKRDQRTSLPCPPKQAMDTASTRNGCPEKIARHHSCRKVLQIAHPHRLYERKPPPQMQFITNRTVPALQSIAIKSLRKTREPKRRNRGQKATALTPVSNFNFPPQPYEIAFHTVTASPAAKLETGRERFPQISRPVFGYSKRNNAGTSISRGHSALQWRPAEMMTGWSSRSFLPWELFRRICVDLSDHSSQASDQIATGYVLDQINIQSANLEQTELLSMIRMTGQGKGNSGKGSSEPSPRRAPLPACLQVPSVACSVRACVCEKGTCVYGGSYQCVCRGEE